MMKVPAGSCKLQVVSADRRRVVVVVFSLNGNLRKQAELLAWRHTWRALRPATQSTAVSYVLL